MEVAAEQKWLEEIPVEQLPEAVQVLARVIGVEAAVKLSEELGGTSFYFPKIDRLLQRVRDKKIRQEFSGYNCRELALKYHLSENWVRKIVTGKEPDGEFLQIPLL